jgi:hypothetical protein
VYGPSYPTLAVSFDRKSGQYKARSQAKKDDKQTVASGKFEMPADLYNGMALMLLENLPGGADARGHMALFTSEPRLIEMEWSGAGRERMRCGWAAEP